jgi:hypothetical protein
MVKNNLFQLCKNEKSYKLIYIIIYLLLTLIPLLSLKRYYLVDNELNVSLGVGNNNINNILLQPFLLILVSLLFINFFIIKIIKKYQILERISIVSIVPIVLSILKKIKFKTKYTTIGFILLYLVISILPITRITNDEILRLSSENRNANRYKPFKLKFKSENDKKEYLLSQGKTETKIPEKIINFNYGNDFNRWFGDRFRKRRKIIAYKDKIYIFFIIFFYFKRFVSVGISIFGS